MATNRTHQGESRENRLARFKNGHPHEAVESLINSIDNYFNNEIVLTPSQHQTTLLFLGIHAGIETLCEAFYGNSSTENFKRFLETFIDQTPIDRKFSLIARELNDWRNILAHQWIGSMGHSIGYDYESSLGWRSDGNVTYINPEIFCDCYLGAFSAGGKVHKYHTILTLDEIDKASLKIIKKYEAS